MGRGSVFGICSTVIICTRRVRGTLLCKEILTPCFIVPQFDLVLWVKFDDFMSVFCFLFGMI
jgi:hypothetical protein